MTTTTVNLVNATLCEHDTMTAVRQSGDTTHATAWGCDWCDHVEPMTAMEADWSRQDVAKCVRCHQSAAFGPLVTQAGLLGTYLAHTTCPTR